MSDDKTVQLVDMSQEQAAKRFENESRKQETVGGINQAVVRFTQVDDFTTFKAEYSWVEGDIIIHFFITSEMKKLNTTEEGGPAIKQYWLHTFPLALDRALKEYFQADTPRVQAKYTPELASWWVRAQNYGDRIDPDLFVVSFFEALDQALESSETPSGSPGN